MKIDLDRFPEGKQKALTMSYDDGVYDDIKLVEIFNEYGIKGTFHLNGGLFGKESWTRLTQEQVENIYHGHEISAHGYTHRSLTSLTDEGILYEIMQDRICLEKITKMPIRGMSYPLGTMNRNVRKILKSSGIEYARVADTSGGFNIPDDFLQWKGTCHHNEGILEKGKEFLKWVPFQMTLMYVWGHSFEFSRDNNWELIEEFCKMLGGREDIWYATNIEICDYVKAVRRLKFSANQDVVLNQSMFDVWISVDDYPVKISGGECLKL